MINKDNNFIKKLFCKCTAKKPLVNVINLDGIIGSSGMKQGLNLHNLNTTLEKAFAGKNLVAVFLNINSPGGSPVQSEIISKRIKQLANKKKIPIIAIIEDIAASGGYWLACSAQEIIAAENSIIGSLGVKFSSFGFTKLIDKYGIERRVHTKGESKAFLDPFLPEKEEDIAIILKVQEDIYQNFKQHVHLARQNKLNITDEILFSGAIWSAKEALNIGLIDKISNLYYEIEQRYGEDSIIKIVNTEKSWLKKKLSINLDFGRLFDNSIKFN